MRDKEEFRIKMREVMNRPEIKNKIIKTLSGRKLTDGHKRNIGLGNKGKHHSIETRRKMSLSHIGINAYNWKGGVASENKRIRLSIEFRLWREAVFARDSWICQKCKLRSGNGKTFIIHPHHIKPFALYPNLRFAIDNGITLCKDCHKLEHQLLGGK